MKTEEKKVLERGKRRWANYRWTNAMVDELFRLQNGKCGVCGEPLGSNFNIDHLHFHVKSVRVRAGSVIPMVDWAIPPKWYAYVIEFPDILVFGHTKKFVEQEARNQALPRSVRGLLHSGRMGCNRRLGRVDDPKWLRNAANYLENPPSKKILDKTQII